MLYLNFDPAQVSCICPRTDYGRRNKVLLSLYKSRGFIHWCRLHPASVQPADITELLPWLRRLTPERPYDIELVGSVFFVVNTEVGTPVDRGVCEDGTNRIRYRSARDGRIYGMRPGKFFENTFKANFPWLPADVVRWWTEKECEAWNAYYLAHRPARLHLHIGDDMDDFHEAYTPDYLDEDTYFGSCMEGRTYAEDFYPCVDGCKIASLRDDDNVIYARAVIFTATRRDGTKVRLLERQYGKQDNCLMLIEECYKAGAIDANKRAGSSCHQPADWVTHNGEPLPGRDYMSIELTSEPDSYVYMDSFKWCTGDTLYNYESEDTEYILEETNGERERIRTACPRCGDLYVGGNGYYSDLTGEEYCCYECRQEAEKEYLENNWHSVDRYTYSEDYPGYVMSQTNVFKVYIDGEWETASRDWMEKQIDERHVYVNGDGDFVYSEVDQSEVLETVLEID